MPFLDEFGGDTLVCEPVRTDKEVPLSTHVACLEKRCQALDDFAGSVILTLDLPANAHVFESCPPEFHEMVRTWRRQYDRIRSK